MQEFIDKFIEAAKAEPITFESLPEAPVYLHDASSIDNQSASKIIERYTRHGFVVAELLSDAPTPETLLKLGESLGLCDPFVPPLYTQGEYRSEVVSQISRKIDSQSSHPTFETSSGLEFHCDGTLQKIGYVKTSILLCKSPGFEGGETTLFNALGAFTALIDKDPEAAMTLIGSGVLVRQANINGCSDINKRPAFTIQEGKLVCAYSVAKTDSLVAEDGIDPLAFRRAKDFLHEASQPGSPYFMKFLLQERQAIILFNCRICHGRTPYRDCDGNRRCLYRSLYLSQPQIMQKSST